MVRTRRMLSMVVRIELLAKAGWNRIRQGSLAEIWNL